MLLIPGSITNVDSGSILGGPHSGLLAMTSERETERIRTEAVVATAAARCKDEKSLSEISEIQETALAGTSSRDAPFGCDNGDRASGNSGNCANLKNPDEMGIGATP